MLEVRLRDARATLSALVEKAAQGAPSVTASASAYASMGPGRKPPRARRSTRFSKRPAVGCGLSRFAPEPERGFQRAPEDLRPERSFIVGGGALPEGRGRRDYRADGGGGDAGRGVTRVQPRGSIRLTARPPGACSAAISSTVGDMDMGRRVEGRRARRPLCPRGRAAGTRRSIRPLARGHRWRRRRIRWATRPGQSSVTRTPEPRSSMRRFCEKQVNRAFRCAVDGGEQGVEAGDRADIDDVAAPARAHSRQHGAGWRGRGRRRW